MNELEIIRSFLHDYAWDGEYYTRWTAPTPEWTALEAKYADNHPGSKLHLDLMDEFTRRVMAKHKGPKMALRHVQRKVASEPIVNDIAQDFYVDIMCVNGVVDYDLG